MRNTSTQSQPLNVNVSGLGGAKNHAIVMPDSIGQRIEISCWRGPWFIQANRCNALSVCRAVGKGLLVTALISKMAEKL